MSFRSLTAFAVFVSVSSPLMASTPAPSCDNSSLRLTVQNLSNSMQDGYVADQGQSAFSVGPKESSVITVQTAKTGVEHKVEIYLSDTTQYQDLESESGSSRRCTGLIELPTGCASTDAPAGRLYIYKTAHGEQCFVRTVARLPRANSPALAMTK